MGKIGLEKGKSTACHQLAHQGELKDEKESKSNDFGSFLLLYILSFLFNFSYLSNKIIIGSLFIVLVFSKSNY
jgi:hypothetical protein